MTEQLLGQVEPSSKETCASAPASPSPSSSKAKASKNQRKSTSLPSKTVEYLKAWMMSPEHIAHPYPTEQEKAQIMADTGIELKQLTNWFVNNRKRYWKPRVEARLQQQAQAAAAAAQAHAAAVAAVTAASHGNPVTPDGGFKPTLTLQPNNGFISFDLGSTQPPSKTMPLQMVGTDFTRVISSQSSLNSVNTVSETSSAGSVSGSDSEGTDSSPEDDLPHESIKTSEAVPQTVDDATAKETVSTKSQAGEGVYAINSQLAPISPMKRRQADECEQSPRKRFRRVSMELWRDACMNATGVNDVNLPSLEEATQLFGFTC